MRWLYMERWGDTLGGTATKKAKATFTLASWTCCGLSTGRSVVGTQALTTRPSRTALQPAMDALAVDKKRNGCRPSADGTSLGP